jgi:hypothetical protein
MQTGLGWREIFSNRMANKPEQLSEPQISTDETRITEDGVRRAAMV